MTFRLAPILLLLVAVVGCGTAEDPARVELRSRLKQDSPLSQEEIGRLLDETARAIQGKKVRASQGGTIQDLDDAQRDVVLGMLTRQVGVFDEGVRTLGGRTVRVVNAPGKPSNAELDAARHLSIDLDTFLPAHFQFTSGVASDEFECDLVVEPVP